MLLLSAIPIGLRFLSAIHLLSRPSIGRNSIVPCIALRVVLAVYHRNMEGKHHPQRKDALIFFISSVGWGIELLRDGDRIDGHVSRFQEGGAYHPWLASGDMKEFVILDCCKTIPSKPCSMCFLIPRCIPTEIVCRCGLPFPCGLQ